MDQAQHVAFRQVYPLALLTALTANSHGGKPKKEGTKVKDSTPFETREFIPPYAAYAPMMTVGSSRNPLEKVDRVALQELYDRRNEVSSMFFGSCPWREIRERLGIIES